MTCIARNICLALGVSLASSAFAGGAQEELIGNPPLLRPAQGAARPALAQAGLPAPRRLNLLRAPLTTELAPGIPREVELNLSIQYVNGWIRNPSSEKPGETKYDKVSLRSYVQGDGGPAKSTEAGDAWGSEGQTVFVAPRIEAYPGQTVRVTLNNNLPADPSCIAQGGSSNIPHCFNGTNLHTHGLWINPAGNSDNVLISINPGVGFQYEYNIPPTHPAGTFWYHTHRHGSTALQVSSGMAGALIVRGTRPPTLAENGDIDTLIKPYGGVLFPERVLVFQQIQYACRFASGLLKGQIKTYGNDPVSGPRNPGDGRYKCDQGDVGKIDGYDLFGPGSWQQSGRYTSINGVVLGKLAKAKAGVVERWRMIHGGVRDTIAFKIRRRAEHAPAIAGLKASETEDYVKRYCTGPELDLSLIAADGLTLSKVMPRKTVTFQPAYRWDALVLFPRAGDYCVVNDVKVASTIDRAAPSARLLGLVEVEPGAPVNGGGGDLQAKLVAAAKANLPRDVSAKVVNDLNGGLKLSSFMPHRSVGDAELTGQQTLTFNIDTSRPGAATFQVDGRPFDGSRIDRVLPLGGVDEWTLSSAFVSHPFHIHVNPFQILKILTPDGVDISGDGGKDPDDDDPQYIGMKGVWKDTIWLKNLFASNDPAKSKQGEYTIVVRTRYERYIGDFVLHCHILDHEDQGMMQNIRVALPDGKGGAAHGHH